MINEKLIKMNNTTINENGLRDITGKAFVDVAYPKWIKVESSVMPTMAVVTFAE